MQSEEKLADVWVELPDADEALAIAAENSKKLTAKDIVKHSIHTHYERGKCSSHALFIADLTRRAQSAKALALESSALNANDLGKLSRGAVDVAVMTDNTMVDVFLNGVRLEVSINSIFQANDEAQVNSAADLTGLTFLEEPNILHSLHVRYLSDQIYTSIAGIMVALNPYKNLPVYSKEIMKMYRKVNGTSVGHKAPHIYSVSEEAYSNLTANFSRNVDRPENQSLIVCGESGSGKTENAKHIMRFLANRASKLDLDISNESKEVEGSIVERQVMETNYVLESFGNAATLLNHNSSRFGKFTKMYFRTSNLLNEDEKKQFYNDLDRVVGASTETYLLEKSRVVLQSKGERNFHIFYEIFEASPEQLERLHLKNFTNKDFKYTLEGVPDDSSQTVQRRKVDAARFEEMLTALRALGISSDRHFDILSIVAGVLHLGNINFIEDRSGSQDGSAISKESTRFLSSAAHLFGLNAEKLQAKLVTQRIQLPRESIVKKIPPSEARISRDAISKAVYESLFLWLVRQINLTLEQDVMLPWIGILDVFGFEIFEVNSFEQFMINYANERLQQHFNNSILKSEQAEYLKESIIWNPINVPDGQEAIDLIEKNWTGILSLLDSACRMSSSTVQYFLESMFKAHPKHPLLGQIDFRARARSAHGKKSTNQSRNLFLLKHYAGEVEYTADEFLLKNKDRADPDVEELFKSSTNVIVSSLFVSEALDSELGGKKKGTAAVSTTVSKTFLTQLKSLISTLQQTRSYFIRCIKPNLEVKPRVFDPYHVRPQLQCGGIVQAVKMLKFGYPTRVAYDEIFKQYISLLTCDYSRVESLNRRHFCQAVLSVFGLQSSDFQLGLTKVFFKSEKRNVLHLVLNYDKKFTPQQMKVLFKFLTQRKWQRILAVTRLSCRLFRRIERHRALVKFQKFSMLLVHYHRSFGRLHRHVAAKLAAQKLQMEFYIVLAKLCLNKIRLQVQAEKRAKEEEAKRKREEEERIAQEKADALEAEQRAKMEQSEREARDLQIAAQRRAERLLREKEEKERRELEEKRLADERMEAERLKILELEKRLQEQHEEKLKKELQEKEEQAKKQKLEQELRVKFEEESIAREAQMLSAIADRIPSQLEEELSIWIEELLHISVSSYLIYDIYNGVMLVQLMQKLNPRLNAVKIEDPITDAAIDSNITKFLGFAKGLGISPDLIFAPEELRNCTEGDAVEEKIFKLLDQIKHKFSRNRRGGRTASFKIGGEPSKSDDSIRSASKDEELKIRMSNQVQSTINSSEMDQLREKLEKLDSENVTLRKQLEEYREVVTKLKLTIQSLDKINRNIVEDLHMELQFRSEGSHRRSSASSEIDLRGPHTPMSVPASIPEQAEQTVSAEDRNCVLQ